MALKYNLTEKDDKQVITFKPSFGRAVPLGVTALILFNLAIGAYTMEWYIVTAISAIACLIFGYFTYKTLQLGNQLIVGPENISLIRKSSQSTPGRVDIPLADVAHLSSKETQKIVRQTKQTATGLYLKLNDGREVELVKPSVDREQVNKIREAIVSNSGVLYQP